MMTLDFVNESQPQIRWLDKQLQFFKYKTRVKGQVKDTISEERKRRRVRRKKKCPRRLTHFPRHVATTQILRQKYNNINCIYQIRTAHVRHKN